MRTSANVQTPSGEGEHRLAEAFRQGRVRLDELRDLVDGGFPIDRQISLAELFGDPRPHHVHAEDPSTAPVGIPFGYDLHEAFCVTEDARSAVATERVLLHHHVVARLARSRL